MRKTEERERKKLKSWRGKQIWTKRKGKQKKNKTVKREVNKRGK